MKVGDKAIVRSDNPAEEFDVDLIGYDSDFNVYRCQWEYGKETLQGTYSEDELYLYWELLYKCNLITVYRRANKTELIIQSDKAELRVINNPAKMGLIAYSLNSSLVPYAYNGISAFYVEKK